MRNLPSSTLLFCVFSTFPLAAFKTDLIICVQQSGYDLPCVFLLVLVLEVSGYSDI